MQLSYMESSSGLTAQPLFLVCSAWLLATGCKSPMSPNSGNHTANSNGVPRELESERSWRQISGLTNRNFI